MTAQGDCQPRWKRGKAMCREDIEREQGERGKGEKETEEMRQHVSHASIILIE